MKALQVAVDRVAIVCDSPIWEQSFPPNGFDDRYIAVVQAIATTYPSVLVLYVDHSGATQRSGDDGMPDSFRHAVEALGDGVRFTSVDASGVSPSANRFIDRPKQLLLNLCRRPTFLPWMGEADRILDAWQPDVVVAPAHPFWLTVSQIGLRHPLVLMAEEDFRSSSDYPSRTKLGRLLQRLEYAAVSRSTPAPACVVVISENETQWAGKQFGRSRICVVPHCLDETYWRPSDREPERRDVFCCGHMGQLRNARGLSAITRALSGDAAELDGARIMIASAWPWNTEVPAPPHMVATFLGEVDDPRAHYWASLATLVPAFEVTGAKTTILQGWATGCPVITSSASAASVGGRDGVDVVAGDDADAVAAAVVRVLGDADLRGALAANGLARYRRQHTTKAVAAAIRATIDEAGTIGIVGRTPRGREPHRGSPKDSA